MTRTRRTLLALAVFGLAAAFPLSAHAAQTLYAKTGPGVDITLKTASGQKVTRLRAGTYRIVVVDRTGGDAHNFHLRGRGVDRSTSVRFVGRTVWTVTFRRASVYRFVCDPHVFVMHGSFRTF